MLHVRIKMRSGGCAMSFQNTEAGTGAGVGRTSWGWSITEGTAFLTSLCVQAVLKAWSAPLGPPLLERPFFA
jgi:hypothetical protein